MFFAGFVEELLSTGIQRIYPDAIAFALYYSLKHGLPLDIIRSNYREIIEIDDCLADVLLLEFARRHKIRNIQEAIRSRAERLRGLETRETDRYWLLIYQLWRSKTLSQERQGFLAELKANRFSFLRFT